MLGDKNYSYTHRRNTGRVCGKLLSAEGHFITPAVLLGCSRSHRGTQWEWLLYNGVCDILISGKFPNNVLQLLQEAKYGTTVVWYNSDINPSTKGSAPGSISYETRSLR
jgi:hypothetical protein